MSNTVIRKNGLVNLIRCKKYHIDVNKNYCIKICLECD